MSSDGALQRVYIWSLPRTMGTALVKCLSYVDDIQIFYEPLVSSYYYGPDVAEARKTTASLDSFMEKATANHLELDHAFDDSICSYEWVKKELESEYPGKKILLAKDQAICLDGKYDMLPSGFRYAFLIRHPYRVLPSWKATIARLMNIPTNDLSMVDPEFQKTQHQADIFELQYNLLKYVQKNLDPNVVVIDADDLQSNPSSILRQFCQGVGIPYTDSLLKWPGDRDVMKTWKASRISVQANYLENEGGFYEVALSSTHFLPVNPLPKRSGLPKDIQEIAEKCMQSYEKMREMRLKP